MDAPALPEIPEQPVSTSMNAAARFIEMHGKRFTSFS
jgi:hypothetical protein